MPNPVAAALSPWRILLLILFLSAALRPLTASETVDIDEQNSGSSTPLASNGDKPNRITAPIVPESETKEPSSAPSIPALSESSSDSPDVTLGKETAAEIRTRRRVAAEANETERGSEEEEAIEEFDIWTQKKLEEQQANRVKPTLVLVNSDGSGRVVEEARLDSPRPDPEPSDAAPAKAPAVVVLPLPTDAGVIAVQATQRNYASSECGAKVLLTNPETQHSNAALNEKERDAYMLNPCVTTGGRFFYVELCETVQPTRVDIANFELFSSGPKELVVLGSERYPSSDWVLLGNWTAQDNRDIQSFPVHIPAKTYVKFIKVELVSHYGSEHFCPLSLIRLFGISIVEEYEAEEQAIVSAATATPPPPPPPSEQPTTPPTLHIPSEPAPQILQPPPKDQGILTKAKDMVKGVINKVLGNGDKSKDNMSATCVVGNDQASWRALSESSRQFWYRKCLVSPPVDTSLCHYFAPTPILLNVTTDGPVGTVVRSSTPADTADANLSRKRGPATMPNPKRRKTRQPLFRPNAPHSRRIRRYDQFQRLMSELKVKRKEAEAAELASLPIPDLSPPVVAANETLKAQPIIALPGGPLNPKESLFVRLNNKIRALEQNISLSSQYLSELSKRYRKTLDDIHRQYNRTTRLMNETRRDSEEGMAALAEDLDVVRLSLDELTQANRLFREHHIYVQEELWKYLALVIVVSVAGTALLMWLCLTLTLPFTARTPPPQAPVASSIVDEQLRELRRELDALKGMVLAEGQTPIGNGHGPPKLDSSPPLVADSPSPEAASSEDEDLGSREARCGLSPIRLSCPSALSTLGSQSPAWEEEKRRRRRVGPKVPVFPKAARLRNDNLFRFLNTSPDKTHQ